MQLNAEERPICQHCGRAFGYLIDGKFYPVRYCGHRINGEVWIFEPGKPPLNLGSAHGWRERYRKEQER